MIYGEQSAGTPVKRGFADTAFGQVHYREAGSGPDLVLLHNSWLSSKMFSGVLPVLAERFHVIAFDTLGQGDSDPAPDGDVPMETFASATLDAAHSLGLTHPVFAGHHTGSVIAAAAAIQEPNFVSKLVICGMPFWTNPSDRLAQLDDPQYHDWTPVPDGSHLVPLWQDHSGQARSGFASSVQIFGEFLKPGPRPSLALRALFHWDANTLLPQISVPTLVCCHDSDAFMKFLPDVGSAIPGSVVDVLAGGDPHPIHGHASFAGAIIRFAAQRT